MSNDLALIEIEKEISTLREPFMAALSDKAINFDAEAGFAIQLLRGNSFALTTARGNPQSVRDAVVNIAAVGISLNPAKKQAYLVPRDGKICLDISYMGLTDIAVLSGSIRWVQTRLVHEADVFEMAGIDEKPVHQFKPFDTNRGDVVGVYVVAKTPEGDFLTEPMPTEEVNWIRDRSQAWIAFQEKRIRSCPWHTDWGQMARKTVIKRAYHSWSKTERMDRAIHMMNVQNGEGLDPALLASNTPSGDPLEGGATEKPAEPQRRSATASKPPAPPAPPPPPPPPAAGKTAGKRGQKAQAEDAKVVGESKTIDAGRLAYLQKKMKSIGMDEGMVKAMCTRLKISAVDLKLSVDEFNAVNAELTRMIKDGS